MKPILYAGAALMVGASIYGFVDYKKTSHEKQFTTMYNEVKESKPLPVKEPKVVKKEISELSKNPMAKEKINLKKPKQVNETEAIAEKPVPTASVSEKIVAPVKIKKNRKRITTKIFSRAPIREEMEEEVVLPVAEKTDKKMEIKKQ